MEGNSNRNVIVRRADLVGELLQNLPPYAGRGTLRGDSCAWQEVRGARDAKVQDWSGRIILAAIFVTRLRGASRWDSFMMLFMTPEIT